MSESGMFREALEAIEKKQRVRARDLLTRLLRVDKENIDYWLWLSTVVDTDKERLFCLKSVLRIDPNNEAAQRGLRMMGEDVIGAEIVPVPPAMRKWDIDLGKDDQELTGFRKVLANPVLRLLVFGVSGILLVGLVLIGIFAPRGTIFGPRLTITPIAWSATPSETATETPEVIKDTATPQITSTPQPLWMKLESTYTPTPIYVDTPHPRSEAYQVAMRALGRGDWEAVLSFMEQVQRENPEAPDPYYYMGEAFLQQGNYERALWAFENAIDLDPNFGPAYIGRSQAQIGLGEDVDISADLQNAIALAPDFKDAYLELATHQLSQEDAEGALVTLDGAAELLADHPRNHRLRAEAYLILKQYDDAMVSAQTAYQLDITDLPVYLLLGEVHLRANQPQEALGFIQTYGLYEPEDPTYFSLLGWAHYAIGEDYQAAFDAIDRALALDEENGLAYQIRGLSALEVGDASQAVNDIAIARQLLPDSFELSSGLARAFWAVGNADNAYVQINASEDLAQTDEEFSILYFYRAQIALELAQIDRARLDYQALLDLPEDIVPNEWRAEADLYLNPPTATPTSTSTSTSTLTFTPTPTFTLTPTFTPTLTLTPTSTFTPTLPPTATSTPSLTPTP